MLPTSYGNEDYEVFTHQLENDVLVIYIAYIEEIQPNKLLWKQQRENEIETRSIWPEGVKGIPIRVEELEGDVHFTGCVGEYP